MLEKLPDAIGHALRDVRAGLDNTVFNQSGLRTGLAAITVSSLAFADHAPIPVLYTADGVGLSPPLQWSGVPAGTSSVVLIVEDADAPMPRPLVHAIVVDLPSDNNGALAEGALSSPDPASETLHQGRNSLLSASWLPPDPPPAHGQHRYVFQVFALGPTPDDASFGSTPGRDEVLDAIRSRALASGCLVGTYERHDSSIRDSSAEPTGQLSAI